MGATSAPGNQTIRNRTSTPTSGSSVIRTRLSKTPTPRREPVVCPTIEPTNNDLTPKDVLQAVEEDD